MKLSIVIIGDEILLGQVTDTNSGAVARTFRRMGWQVASIETVGDNGLQISAAVERGLEQSDLVITTGGLGPTKDDITKQVLMSIFGGELRRAAEVTANIERVFALRGIAMNVLTADQALVPTSCRVIQNRYGTAPIMWFERAGKVLVSMPGVPFETEGMLPEVSAAVAARFTPDMFFRHHTLLVSGLSESKLAQQLSAYEASLPPTLHLAYLPQPGLIRLRLDGASADEAALEATFAAALESLRAEVRPLMVHDGDASVAEVLIELLRSRGYDVATAESCTGGNVAHAITMVAGCSDVYRGSVVAYSNEVKERVLGVSHDTLATDGAVSRATVEQMAAGVSRLTGSCCAIATSGIAGPGGATPGKPVGTVWIAAYCCGQVEARELHLPGDRSGVIGRATTEAILMLTRMLRR